MGQLWNELEAALDNIFPKQWTVRDSDKVPEPDDLKLNSNDGVKIDATILYADLAESTKLVDEKTPEFAAEVYKAYLHCAGRIIKNMGGEIVSYDGDRIMAVYVGNSKNTSAAGTALRINGAVTKLINPAIRKQYGDSTYQLQQAVGVDTSGILVAREGVRGDNDLVWIGRAANYAAKLCSYRHSYYSSIITEDVYGMLNDSVKIDERTGSNMWDRLASNYNGKSLYASSWYIHNF